MFNWGVFFGTAMFLSVGIGMVAFLYWLDEKLPERYQGMWLIILVILAIAAVAGFSVK